MLKIINLHVSLEKKEILKGINLEIQANQVHAIMGPNGSGKSTLSSVIAGKKEYNVTKGAIFFEKKNILDMSPERRAHLGIFLSFQDPVDIPGISVINFIITAVNSFRKAKKMEEIPSGEILKKVRKYSKILGIDEKILYRSVNEGFSGGEKKRNEILQMSILNPKFIILDETDSGLDIDSLRVVSNLINAMRSIKTAILIITHYQRILEYLTPDYVHILDNGKIIKSGGKEIAFNLEKMGYECFRKEHKV